jgi:hypothetical protein
VEPLAKLPPELAPLWRAVHSRLSSGRPVGRVRVGPLDAGQQAALADLLGLSRLPGEQPSVSLATLDHVLAESVGMPAREVVAQLIGPLGDRAGDRERAAAQRDGLWAWLGGHPVVRAQPALAPWVSSTQRAGLAGGSVPRTRDELGCALRVLAELRALASIYDVPPPANAQHRRALWERAGVAGDELSTVALAAGLQPEGSDVAARILRVCTEAGQAAALTLGQLRTADWARGPADAWVFENPSVLAMALARFGRRCPPIAVTSGWPSSAVILLLRALRSAGTRLHYHGDFDGEGLRIAAAVVARTGAAPWRMTSADYLRAATHGPPVGRMSDVPWDGALATHMAAAGITVPEERVAAELLDEIAGWPRTVGGTP